MSDDDFPEDTHGGSFQVSESIVLPKYTSWDMKTIYDYENQITDYNTLAELEASIQAARKALFILTDKINKAERKEAASKVTYDRSYRRAWVASNERTGEAKKIRAALKCEDLENEWLKWNQLLTELNRMGTSIRLELQTLQTTANNLRQQLKTI